ncbi:MAG TPA: hypothetical protein VH325_07225 [Bryobacteraceae bacterium]|jgi:hypothetical protein|nr:hypothetical protein [Bryobacteraceae bacterium]
MRGARRAQRTRSLHRCAIELAKMLPVDEQNDFSNQMAKFLRGELDLALLGATIQLLAVTV